MKIGPRAKRVVKSIIADLSDRRGLGDEWSQCDDDVKREIRRTWGEIIDKEIEEARALATPYSVPRESGPL